MTYKRQLEIERAVSVALQRQVQALEATLEAIEKRAVLGLQMKEAGLSDEAYVMFLTFGMQQILDLRLESRMEKDEGVGRT